MCNSAPCAARQWVLIRHAYPKEVLATCGWRSFVHESGGIPSYVVCRYEFAGYECHIDTLFLVACAWGYNTLELSVLAWNVFPTGSGFPAFLSLSTNSSVHFESSTMKIVQGDSHFQFVNVVLFAAAPSTILLISCLSSAIV